VTYDGRAQGANGVGQWLFIKIDHLDCSQCEVSSIGRCNLEGEHTASEHVDHRREKNTLGCPIKPKTHSFGSLSNVIEAQEVEQGQIAIGLGFETPAPFATGDSIVTLRGGLSGIGSFLAETGGALGSGSDAWRAKLDLGFDVELKSGGFVAVDTYYDGLGDADYESYSVEVSYRFEF
jgi:hypothetical protein